MKRLIPFLILIGVVASSCSTGSQTTESPDQSAETPTTEAQTTETPTEEVSSTIQGTVLTSLDGASQITVPEDWNETNELNDVATIQAANFNKEQYVIVIEDSKEDFTDANLDDHSQITSQLIVDGLTAPNLTSPNPITINGYTALQREIQGSFENINVVYLHTSIETPTHFYQIVTWSLKSRFEENRSVFEQVTQSFQEVNS